MKEVLHEVCFTSYWIDAESYVANVDGHVLGVIGLVLALTLFSKHENPTKHVGMECNRWQKNKVPTNLLLAPQFVLSGLTLFCESTSRTVTGGSTGGFGGFSLLGRDKDN